MARSSGQKFIARSRIPRVQIQYDVEVYGASSRIHLPFVIGVFADLAGHQNKPPSLEVRRMKEIDVDNFDMRLREQLPRITFQVPDTIRGNGELEVDLTFESMDDFLPGAIASKIIGLRELLEGRTQLVNLATYMDGKSGAEELVERILNNAQLQDEIVSKTAALPLTPADDPPAAVEDSFHQLLEKEFRPKTEPALAELTRAVRTLAEYALAGRGSVRGDAIQSIVAIVRNIDGKLEQQVNMILHHPDFQRLESAWRGLNYLVSNTETDDSLKIRFMSLSKAELGKVISRYRGSAWDQSPLFKKVYDEVFGQMGGEPYGCLVGDYEFAHGPKDLEMLRGVAEIAAAAHAPFLTAGSPALVHAETWNQVTAPYDISSAFSTSEYAGWRSLRESEESRYLALTMPRFLARVPYGAKTSPVEEFAFEETARGPDRSCFVWANSAYALAAKIGQAFKLYGWCARIRGVESGGMVESLPSYPFPGEDGGLDRSSMEISITDRLEAELGANGMSALVHRKNTDSAIFISARSLHKPDEYDDPDVTAGAALAARLPYLLPCCRFVHYLKCIARDAVGSFASREAMEERLNDWILQYVDHDPGNSSEQRKVSKPLADAQIVLEPIEGTPTRFLGKIYIRPQYQLEGLTVSLRLIAKFP